MELFMIAGLSAFRGGRGNKIAWALYSVSIDRSSHPTLFHCLFGEREREEIKIKSNILRYYF